MAAERELADQNTPHVRASADIQNVRRRLMTLANLPDNALTQKRAILKSITESKKLFFALDVALMSIGDDELRHRLMEFIMREGDRGLDHERGNDAPVVAVGVLFEGSVPTADPEVLQTMMTGTASHALSLDFDDPGHPGRKASMVAFPLHEWRCMFLMLANRLFPVSRDMLMGAWQALLTETTRPCVCYLFSPPLSEIDTTTPDWTFSGPVFDRYMAAIELRAQLVRERWPQAGITLRPAARLSQAIQPLQEASIALAVKEEHRAIRRAQAEWEQQEGEKVEDEGEWPESTTAIVSLTTWESASIQTADILLLNPDKPQTTSAQALRYQVSGLSTVESLRHAVEGALNPEGLTVVTLPSAPSPGSCEAPVASRLHRDADGRWLAKCMFNRAYAARQLLNNDEGAVFLRAESEEKLRELCEVPTPVLCQQQVDLAKFFHEHFRADVAERIVALGHEPGLSYTQAHTRLKAEYPGLRNLHSELPPSSSPMGLRYDTYLAYHFRKCEGRLFHIRQALIERLDFTDIEDGVPVSYLRAPFADCYFHLERPQEVVPGQPLDKEIRLQGFYITQQALPRRGWRLAIAPVVTQGAEVLYAEALEIELALEAGDSRGLLKVLNEIRANAGERLLTSQEHLYRILNLSAKIMLYLGLRSARLIDHPDRTRALEQFADRSPGERKRQARRVGNLYDFIEVGPEKSMKQEHAEVGGTLSARVFWRRGFFRMQAYGPHWSMHRHQWIQPTIVNADLLTKGDDLPPVRRYRVGGKTNGRPRMSPKR